MPKIGTCFIALALVACGDSAPGAAGGGAGFDDSGAATMTGTDAPVVETKPSEAGAGSGGSNALPPVEAGHGDEAAFAMPDGSDGASAMFGPDRWVGTPFVMDTWFWTSSGPVADRVTLLQQLGYQGLALSADHQVAEYVTEMLAKGLKMPGIWTPVDAGGYPTGLVKAITGTGGWIWLSITSKTNSVSDPAGDAVALSLVQKLADECHAAGLPGVALYPHVGNWLERVSDGVRLAKKAARPEVGVVFNQYHWMVAEQGRDLAATLASALPYLKAVTINGSDVAPSILPLGQGSYDVASILRALSVLDFRVSVGLQGYSISGDIPGKLQSSKQTWDAMVRALPRDGG